MGGSHGEGDGLIDYVAGVVFLAILLIVALAVVGSELADILQHT